MAGLYGKIPGKGDFIKRNVTDFDIDIVDKWFQQGMQKSRSHLESQWLQKYAVAPIWHGYLPSGLVCNSACLVVFMPSVDRVGRHFPLILIQPLETQLRTFDDLKKYSSWFVLAEELLLDGLEPDVNYEQFSAQVDSLGIDNLESDNLESDSLVPEHFGGSALINLLTTNTTSENPQLSPDLEQQRVLALNEVIDPLSEQSPLPDTNTENKFISSGEALPCTLKSTAEYPVGDSPEQQIENTGAKSNTPSLTPESPMEKAMMLKIGMLESITKTLCEKLDINYDQLVETFIAGLNDEQRSAAIPPKQGSDSSSPLSSKVSEQQATPIPRASETEIALNQNLHEKLSTVSNGVRVEFENTCCVWMSEGNEEVRQQIVVTRGLPATDVFWQFLAGFPESGTTHA